MASSSSFVVETSEQISEISNEKVMDCKRNYRSMYDKKCKDHKVPPKTCAFSQLYCVFFCVSYPEPDIDECKTGSHDCHMHARCTNTDGSFHCACSNGHSGDGKTCVDVNECLVGIHSCDVNAICHNTIGSFSCICKGGFQGNGTSCTPFWETGYIYKPNYSMGDIESKDDCYQRCKNEGYARAMFKESGRCSCSTTSANPVSNAEYITRIIIN
eukprot:gene16476-7892_t